MKISQEREKRLSSIPSNASMPMCAIGKNAYSSQSLSIQELLVAGS
jgi:hypothetical protein